MSERLSRAWKNFRASLLELKRAKLELIEQQELTRKAKAEADLAELRLARAIRLKRMTDRILAELAQKEGV